MIQIFDIVAFVLVSSFLWSLVPAFRNAMISSSMPMLFSSSHCELLVLGVLLGSVTESECDSCFDPFPFEIVLS